MIIPSIFSFSVKRAAPRNHPLPASGVACSPKPQAVSEIHEESVKEVTDRRVEWMDTTFGDLD